MNSYFIRAVIFALMISLVPQQSFARANFALKFKLPAILNDLSDAWQKIQNSALVCSIDSLLSVSGSYNLLFRSLNPKVVIIPPAGLFLQKPCLPAKQLRVLTANLKLFPAPFFFNQQERIKEFAKAARHEHADILFLQEVWDNISLFRLICSFPDFYSIFAPDPLYNHSGLLILSRFPVNQASLKIFNYSLQHNPEEFMAWKGILSCSTEFCGQQLFLMNTHLYSSPVESSYRPNLEQFNRLIKIAVECPNAVLIGGDMNLRPKEAGERLPQAICRDQCNLPTAGAPERKAKLDYLLVKDSDKLKLQLFGQRLEWPVQFSDHSPVIGSISSK